MQLVLLYLRDKRLTNSFFSLLLKLKLNLDDMVLSKLPRFGERFDIRIYENRGQDCSFQNCRVAKLCFKRETDGVYRLFFILKKTLFVVEILLASTQLQVTRRFP